MPIKVHTLHAETLTWGASQEAKSTSCSCLLQLVFTCSYLRLSSSQIKYWGVLLADWDGPTKCSNELWMTCGLDPRKNFEVCSCVCVVCPLFQCIHLNLRITICASWACMQCVCICVWAHTNANSNAKKKACVVTAMLFMALVVSWKGIAVYRVSLQTFFIIIIIIIINHPSSGVSGPSNALNHWPGHTWILHLKRRWRQRTGRWRS